ncbi:hypothetical protein FSU_3169 [Fibrobacter succinogenes subsp. succinogenes S85]|uniref:Uncharacterized protein n=1 Tax=Fibrobacter succinogenes (strain ATCC 19169 / S85) TaxID=59374 RepID=C9RMF2_FIBSS|nr:hypothetical protein [Fibrobacter succinogenes]ACX76184.1 hypothetical protein Fisuc_2600 [Fibrobacter succinogenes subsp. succinogenes S85]ADL25975.1 hypothetical protein FSU_3169 [Fibrobacter succinogenes subsp. succinogenes S85]
MPIIKTHNCTNIHISRIGIGNTSKSPVSIVCNLPIKNKEKLPKFNTPSGMATLAAMETVVISVKDLDVSEGSTFTILLSNNTAKSADKVEIHMFNFTYSKFSDSTATIDTSNLDRENIINYPEDDHFADHVKRLVLENKGAYIAKFRIHYYNAVTKEWGYKTSSSFTAGKSKYWDCITELHLPNNSIVFPEVVVVAGKNKKCDKKFYYVRQDSTKVVTYKCTGTTLKPSISEC